MPLPETIPPLRSELDCQPLADLGSRWMLDASLTVRLGLLAARVPFPVRIISGFRTRAQQEDLIQRPDTTAAPVDLSNHTVCPARAADLEPNIGVTDAVKIELGRAAVEVGLRWGGGAPVDDRGIPRGNEWRHVDLGPRPR